jgi:hypothetical protein
MMGGGEGGEEEGQNAYAHNDCHLTAKYATKGPSRNALEVRGIFGGLGSSWLSADREDFRFKSFREPIDDRGRDSFRDSSLEAGFGMMAQQGWMCAGL